MLMHTRGGITIVIQQEKLKTKPDNKEGIILGPAYMEVGYPR